MCVMLVCMALSLDKQLFISLLFRVSTPLPFRLSSCFSSSYYSPSQPVKFLVSFCRYHLSSLLAIFLLPLPVISPSLPVIFLLLLQLFPACHPNIVLPHIWLSSCLLAGYLSASPLLNFLPLVWKCSFISSGYVRLGPYPSSGDLPASCLNFSPSVCPVHLSFLLRPPEAFQLLPLTSSCILPCFSSRYLAVKLSLLRLNSCISPR